MSDSRSGMAQMRFGNENLKNLVWNSAFEVDSLWEYNNALYHDSLRLYEIPIPNAGNYFYQAIAPESLQAFEGDTLLLWIDLVSDTFVGTGKVEFQYIYSDTSRRGDHHTGTEITIPQGTKAWVSDYNLYSCFEFRPDTDSVFTEARVGVFVDSHSVIENSGRLFIDNLRLDVVGPADDYTKFEAYDSPKSWTLASGNGVRKVYGQFADSAGNETAALWDSIIVDTTKPVAIITSPQDDQVLSGNVGITGYAYDYADPVQHFKEYGLYYQGIESEDWYGVHPDSIFYNPVDSNSPSQELAKWDTKEVTENHGDGWYHLRLAVSDLADNHRGDTVLVRIRNDRGAKGEIAGFTSDVYGLAAADEIFVGELGTGKIYRYDSCYQLLDTFALVDSIGIGLPLAMTLDDSGKLWVTNITSHYVNRFTPQGDLLLQFAGGFSLPSGITLDETGNEWISDRLHHKIKKFDVMGNLLYQFGIRGRDPGEIDRPIGLTFCDDKVYIADSRNRRISIFDTLGTFIRTIGDSAGLLMPFGLVADSTGCVFVSDVMGNQVIEFGPSGNRLFGIDSILDSPTGLALSLDAKTLYISDTRNKRVLAYEVRSEPPLSGGGPQAIGQVDIDKLAFDIFPSPFTNRLTIKLRGVVGKRVILKFYDATGRLIKTFLDCDLVKIDQNIIWDGHDNQQRKCAAGIYFLRLEIGEYRDMQKVVLLR